MYIYLFFWTFGCFRGFDRLLEECHAVQYFLYPLCLNSAVFSVLCHLYSKDSSCKSAFSAGRESIAREKSN